MTILCSGSLALDKIMDYNGVFGEHILPDKLPQINISYLVDSLIQNFGGTAGNIAYNLALMEEKPVVLSTLGQDSDFYTQRFSSLGLPLDGIRIIENEMTATCYLYTDREKNQLVFFHPAAMGHSCDFDFTTMSDYQNHLAIVSPGNLADMKGLCQKYRELKLPFIYDPGQQVIAFSGEELLDMLSGAKILITNEYELGTFLSTTGKTVDELFEYTETIITTMGEKGSYLRVPYKGSTHIGTVPPFQVVDPTGAGDAFRAGLIKGLTMGVPMVTACRMGSTAASFCVESPGPQVHTFTLPQMASRHMSAFKESWL